MSLQRNLFSFVSGCLAISLTVALPLFAAEEDRSPIASVRLYNPTSCDAETTVEVPVGSLGNPEAIDWRNVSLRYDSEAVPFSLREGAAHWRAKLTAPLEKPSAEDLLVFSVRVPPGHWKLVDLVPGAPDQQSALVRENEVLRITYPEITVLVNERTGQLTSVQLGEESVLSDPLSYRFFDLGEGTAEPITYVGPGYLSPVVSMKKEAEQPPPTVRLVSRSSNAALTELNFILQPQHGPSVGLTYRIYANRQIEILSDERPWDRRSPWLDCCLEYELPLSGTSENLPYEQSHLPYYGFKDYAAAIKSVGIVRRGTKTFSFERGEESVNGRFWRRQLTFYPMSEWENRDGLLQLLEQGLVVQTDPIRSQPLNAPLRVGCTDEAQSVGELLLDRLRQKGIEATLETVASENSVCEVGLRLLDGPEAVDIRGDGFAVVASPQRSGVEILAGTKFGLFRGVSQVLRKMPIDDKTITVPLIAENPVVDLRSGGFGGGNFEVDFPYGDETEWKSTFDQLADSGMNVMGCLGMWGNWKMPIRYKYMPELWSDDPAAYDELSGARFVDFEMYHEKSIRLTRYLHDRGVKIWLWIPLGTIPTSFEEKYPEATTPKNRKVPRVTHPKYQEFLRAYFREIRELYPVDGFVLIRDDNGGLDDTEEYKEFVNNSRTKSPAWEACLLAYDLLRDQGFKGTIAVYPYFDAYQPRLDPLLPEDLLLVGHGSGLGLLSRQFDRVAPMGDTWLDNPYSGAFRLPSSPQMKRLLSDRNSFWIGGAFRGTELPWESLGYFGEQPTATVNTFRYQIGGRMFGFENAIAFVGLSQAYESLWEIVRDRLLPHDWLKLDERQRAAVVDEGRRKLEEFRRQFGKFKGRFKNEAHEKWLAQVGLYDSFFEYQLRRAELFGKMLDTVVARSKTAATPTPLPEPERKELLGMNAEIFELARRFNDETAKVPSEMLKHTVAGKLTWPYKEWVLGYDASLEYVIGVKQFAARVQIAPPPLVPGEPFELSVELSNDGCVPWTPEAGPRLELQGDTKRFGLPESWDFEGEPIAYGEKRVIVFRGTAPEGNGTETLKVQCLAPFRDRIMIGEGTAELTWSENRE